MPTQTHPPASGFPQGFSGDPLLEEIYNLLMHPVEPELTTDMLPFLDELYADEPEPARKARGERYARAFALVNERFADLLSLWKGELKEKKQQLLTFLKAKAGTEERQTLSDLDTAIGNA